MFFLTSHLKDHLGGIITKKTGQSVYLFVTTQKKNWESEPPGMVVGGLESRLITGLPKSGQSPQHITKS